MQLMRLVYHDDERPLRDVQSVTRLSLRGEDFGIADATPGLYVHTGNLYRFTLEQAAQLRAFLNNNHQKLRPGKDWSRCPHERHGDDCDCGGAGGDR